MLKVRAVDLDTGPNGNVTYLLVTSNDQPTERFQVERHTGVLRTADVFDREAEIGVTDYRVTVKADVNGSRSEFKDRSRSRQRTGSGQRSRLLYRHGQGRGRITMSTPMMRVRTSEGRVKVKAEDMGTPRLAGFCTFRVRIGDRNDNPPVFNLPHYTTSVEENCPVGRRVKQVRDLDE